MLSDEAAPANDSNCRTPCLKRQTCSDVFKDFMFKAKAKDLQKKQGQGQGQEILKANAEDIQKPLPQQHISCILHYQIMQSNCVCLSSTIK